MCAAPAARLGARLRPPLPPPHPAPQIEHTDVSGSLPSEWGTGALSKALRQLIAGNTQLAGVIPDSFGNLFELGQLELDNTKRAPPTQPPPHPPALTCRALLARPAPPRPTRARRPRRIGGTLPDSVCNLRIFHDLATCSLSGIDFKCAHTLRRPRTCRRAAPRRGTPHARAPPTRPPPRRCPLPSCGGPQCGATCGQPPSAPARK